MSTSIAVMARSVNEYREWIGGEAIESLERLAAPLKGCRVLHLSAQRARPGLSDTLDSLISLSLSMGMAAEWRAIPAGPQLTPVERTLNLALDGHFVEWTPKLWDLWLGRNRDLAELSLKDYDFVVVHGVELAGVLAGMSSNGGIGHTKWIWHCHSDLEQAQPDIRDFLTLYTRGYHMTITSGLRRGDADPRNPHRFAPPAIDPLSLQNHSMSLAAGEAVLSQSGLDPRRPFVMLILCDNHFASPALGGFRLAKAQLPEMQLLILVMDSGNVRWNMPYPSSGANGLGQEYRLLAADSIGTLEKSVLQGSALAVLDSSDDEVLVPTLLNAMWKERPVIVGNVTAARLGITDEQNGYIGRSPEEYGRRLVRLVTSPPTAKTIGRAAREHVRRDFLVTRLLHAYLSTLLDLTDRGPVAGAESRHRVVCTAKTIAKSKALRGAVL